MEFGARLRELRSAAGLSQEALARELEVSVNTIARYEVGRQTPTLSRLSQIAAYFNVDPRDLLGEARVA